MSERQARPSTDQESAPLLQDHAMPTDASRQHPSLANRIGSIAQEPLTALTKVLLVIALILLLLSSVFIGLFAGAQHKLNLGKHNDPTNGPTITSTLSATVTATSTAISTATTIATTTATTVATSTAIFTSIMTSIETTTSMVTTTVIPAPAPAPTTPSKEVCLTPECIVLSASIISSLDTSQDPCENFYDFANGGWLKQHMLPADKGSFGNFEALAEQNKKLIRTILESSSSASSSSPADDEILRKLRNLYSSCMNEDRLNDIGMIPLSQLVKTIKALFRGDGVAAHDKSDGLTAAVAFLHSRGVEALFSFDIEGDVGVDPNNMTLWFSQPGLGLPSKEYYKDKSILKIYRDVIEKLFLSLPEEEEIATEQKPLALTTNKDSTVWPPWPWPPWGDDEDGGDEGDKKPKDRKDKAHKLATKLVKFESKLAKASLDLATLYQDPIKTYNPLSLSEVIDTLPQIKFPLYFATFAPRSYPDRVIVTSPAYLSSLSNIINGTSSEVIEAYLISRATLSLSSHLGADTAAWQAQRSLQETLSGIKKGAVGDRADYCVGKVEQAMGFAAGRYFVNETFGGDSRQKATKIITNIVKSFEASLTDLKWMDKQSAKAATKKAEAIKVKVGYPTSPNTEDARSIANYYRNVEVDKINFFENMLSATISDQSKKWLSLGRQRDRNSWEMYPSMVNAYFNPPANEIVFPAGILQPPFFAQNWPSYLSYGSFGHVAAHELTHAFDSAGRLYNEKGKLEEWWTNSTSQGFLVKQDCIVKQFSAYTIDDGKGGTLHVNGNLTSGENIGDTGLIQAYRAWRAQFDTSFKNGNEYLLPGLNFTREQLFFISFARIWANNMKNAEAVQRVRTDPHSPPRYRVDGTVYNIPEFAEAFKCNKRAKVGCFI